MRRIDESLEKNNIKKLKNYAKLLAKKINHVKSYSVTENAKNEKVVMNKLIQA